MYPDNYEPSELLSNEIDKTMLAEAVKEIAALREERDRLRAGLAVTTKALEEIRDAKSRWMMNVGSYAGGETFSGFAHRLQVMALMALSNETIAAEIERQRVTASILGKLRGLLGEIEGETQEDSHQETRAELAKENSRL